ncbi:CD97 antigen isoform X2 [Cynoglossus semilaevis]|uniref:CD97 antigen-like n=2 Tax=Cynoglossus semilaevis TaxID=244447 RepID=A0A3P8VXQ3_CYNSE|nr:CD97 antigen-like isoform X2 [Cynoglossus semilaevis]XP_024919937.1 CD97 antigen-like isoform X2 [Cynoglossus semilaevis]
MSGGGAVLILALSLCALTNLSTLSTEHCLLGEERGVDGCIDINECEDHGDNIPPCGNFSTCINTKGSFYCQCMDGYLTASKSSNYSAASSESCMDTNECWENKEICGPNASCKNTQPHYSCICNNGFNSTTGKIKRNASVTCIDIDECKTEKRCGESAGCLNTEGSYRCICSPGFELKSGDSNIRGTVVQCEALNCDDFKDDGYLTEKCPTLHGFLEQLKTDCKELTETKNPKPLQGEVQLKRLLSMMDMLLSSQALNDTRLVSSLLDMTESAMRLIGPFIQTPGKNTSSNHTDLKLLVYKGTDLPRGTVAVSLQGAHLNIQLETAAGDPSYYPGFTTLSLLKYANMEKYTDTFFGKMEPPKGHKFKINSKVVTVTVSNANTSHLKEPITLTLHHLTQHNGSSYCVYWDSSENGGAWSTHGCRAVTTFPESTVCSCNHMSSFAVLMALREVEDKFELQLITWIGLSLSQVCLFLCILTFSLIRSIKSPRTTIHLHLCISLFSAGLIFLIGISRIENKVGCAVVAGLLHFFYLAAFCWMCLEGIQLFRMVVLVFNTNFKTLYMMAGGYGVPAVIVTVSALVNAQGYGTERYCWLNLDLIWSFFGPVCLIIVVNIFFFLITVWKLAQKFSSLNPDLDSLQKIKAFTITAVAQLCVLGIMWIFGCFQFEEGTKPMSYLFTIFGSFQGFMLFVMHCLLSKQVRDEYGKVFSRLCVPQKKSYTEFSYSSKANPSKSTQDTGQTQIPGANH